MPDFRPFFHVELARKVLCIELALVPRDMVQANRVAHSLKNSQATSGSSASALATA